MISHHCNSKLAQSKQVMDSQLNFQITEAYKAVRTNIMFSLISDGCKKIVISSSLAGEGKTTTAVHTAISLAQVNKKILLIDADLRKPKIHQFFNTKNTPGLTNYLAHMADLGNIIHSTSYKNLSLLCSGATVPNPSELLASVKMTDLLNCLAKEFDYIIMDTPPINVVVDALPLIKQSDGVVLVAREGSSTYPELNKTIKEIEVINAKILGIILNGIVSKGKGGYGYKSYGYGNYGTYGY